MADASPVKFKQTDHALQDSLESVAPVTGGCASLIGSMKGQCKVSGDLFSTGLKWDAKS
jgi:hypothetical protein